ncbi:MAG: bactofilin family protein [Acidobacteriota bacterium]
MSPLGKDSGRSQGDARQAATTTTIARGARVNGEIGGGAPVRVEGELAGAIDVGGTVEIASGARVEADVRGTIVRVGGAVTGHVTASKLVELQATSHVVGDVTTPCLHVVEGATLEGRVHMEKTTLPGGTPDEPERS